MHTNLRPSQKIRVAYVEDDENCREVISNELKDYGLNVQSFGNGNALLGWLAAPVDAHVMLLDWDLPDISGIDLVTELSRRGVAVPVIFLTGYATSAQWNQYGGCAMHVFGLYIGHGDVANIGDGVSVSDCLTNKHR